MTLGQDELTRNSSLHQVWRISWHPIVGVWFPLEMVPFRFQRWLLDLNLLESRHIQSDQFAFIVYNSLFTHEVGSICCMMKPCFMTSAISASIFLCTLWTCIINNIGWWHILIHCDVVLTCHTYYPVKRMRNSTSRELMLVIWCFVLLQRPPLPPKICWSLPAEMASVNDSWASFVFFRDHHICSECYPLFGLGEFGRLVLRTDLTASGPPLPLNMPFIFCIMKAL